MILSSCIQEILSLRNIYRPIFETADWEANGEVVELVIGVDCLNLNQLYQIRVCKTSDSNNFKDCPYQGNCPRVFRYVKYKVNEKPTPQSLIPKNIILIIPTIGKGMNSKVGAKISQVGPKPTGVAGSNGRVYGRGSYATTLKDGSAKDSELKSSNTSLEDCSRSFSGFSFPDEDSLTHDGPFSTLEVLEVRIPPRIDSFMSSPESNLIEDDLDSPDSTFEDDQHPGYDCSVKGAPELNTKSDDAFFGNFKDGWRLGTSELDFLSQKVSDSKFLHNVNLLHKSYKPPLCRNNDKLWESYFYLEPRLIHDVQIPKDSELKSSNTSLEDCSSSIFGFSFPDDDSLITYDGPFSTLEVRIPPSFMSSPESNLIDDDLDSPDSTFEMIKSLIETVLGGDDYEDDYYDFDKDNSSMAELVQHGMSA
ncbi:hypothetical protein RYX36_021389 [Vicia faba]